MSKVISWIKSAFPSKVFQNIVEFILILFIIFKFIKLITLD